jgi:hypothetical protein
VCGRDDADAGPYACAQARTLRRALSASGEQTPILKPSGVRGGLTLELPQCAEGAGEEDERVLDA